jgi:hypothetical protein
MDRLKRTAVALAAALALGALPSAARANTITVSFVSVVPIGGGLFQWNYRIAEDEFGRATNGAAPGAVSSSSSTEGQTADYFTIYDVVGFMSGSAPANWSIQTLMSGSTPEFIGNPDNAGITNVTFFYTGASTVGPFVLGDFSIVSNSGTSINGYWSSEDTENTGLTDGTTNWSGGHVLVPTTTTPEPASMLLVGSGLLGLGAKFRRRRNA